MPDTYCNVADFLLATGDSAAVALRLLNSTHTYAAVRARSAYVARYLGSLSFEKGDRVVLISDNSFFWVASYLGTLQAGLVCVPLPPAVNPADLDYVIKTTEARAVFADHRCALRNREHFAGLHVVTEHSLTGIAGALSQRNFADLHPAVSARIERHQVAPNDLAALMFTSGSTGKPRGVMVSHANIMANTESIVQYLQLTANDAVMAVLPFHYCFGTSLLHTHLRVGGCLVVDQRFMYPEAVLQRMIETRCTGFAGVPSHFQILLRHSDLKSMRFPSLRYVQQAGGHLSPVFVRELRDALPTTKLFVMYGQTEATARLSYVPPDLLDAKPGSIGRGIPGVKLAVVDETGRPAPPGVVGEIVAEGDNIAQGYWRAPDESARTFRNRKLYTGDLATVDEDGFIYVVGRSKEFLKCGGKRVSCRQIEDRVLECDGVLEAAVVGVPDDVLVEAVKLYIVPQQTDSVGLDERVRSFCKASMASEVIPKQIVLVKSLPKNGAGKVLKELLKSNDLDISPHASATANA